MAMGVEAPMKSAGGVDRLEGGEAAPVMEHRRESEHALSGGDVEARPWRPHGSESGVREKVLWEDHASGSYAGILELAPGARIREHVHWGAVHLLYVLSGTCELSESLRVLGAGGFEFVPPKALHGIAETADETCRLFFVHLAETPRPAP
jgi:quercetin dioxygenase-like cupin family protein